MRVKIPWQKTNAERKAMKDEINRQIIQADAQYSRDLIVSVLWALHVYPKTKYAKKRLKDFYMTFDEVHQDMLDYYKMRDEDTAWLCDRKLKEIGVDIDEWERELKHDKN